MSARFGHRIGRAAVALALGLAVGAGAAAQERGLPPRAPGGSPYDLAGEVVEAFRVVPVRPREGGEHRGHVLEVLLGDRAPRSEVRLEWGGGAAPVRLEDEARGWERGALALLDADGELLLLSELDVQPLAGAVGTARRPSARFSESELRWAWYAIRSGGWTPLARHLHAALRAGETPPGLLELALRFGGQELAYPLLHALGDGRPLPPEVLEVARISLWDLTPAVQAQAVHLLLDHGVELDAESAAMLRRSPRLDHAPLAGALARMGEPRALERLAEELRKNARASSARLDELLEQAAWGDASLLPLVRPHLDSGREAAALAWLALGGAPDAVAAELRYRLHGRGPYRLPLEERRAALASLLAPGDGRNLLTSGRWPRVLALVDEESALSAELRAGLAEELRAARLASSAPVVRAHLATLRLRLGDADALGELERLLSDGELNALQQTFFAAALAEDGSPRALQLFADVLLGVLTEPSRGFCGAGDEQKLATCLDAAASLSASERAHALALFEARLATTLVEGRPLLERLERPDFTDGRLLRIRATLGRPSARTLLACADRWILEDELELELDLDSIRAELAARLPELRRDLPGRWAVLALLEDEPSVPAFGERLLGSDDIARLQALRALRRIGSSAALPYLYDALDDVRPAWTASVWAAIGELERPEQLSRLAAACAQGDGGRGGPAWALLFALTRR